MEGRYVRPRVDEAWTKSNGDGNPSVSVVSSAIHLLTLSGRKPFFVQIGANNGIDFDDFYGVVTSYDLPGLVVEPIPYYFEVLTQAYKRHRQVVPVQVALHPTETNANIYRANPDMIALGWQHGVGYFSRAHLIKYGVAPECILTEAVDCLSMAELVSQFVPPDCSVDILMSDTEGFDAEILDMVDLEQIRPKVVKFESVHLQHSSLERIERRFRAAGYLIERGAEDCVAVEVEFGSRLRYFLRSLGM